MKAWEPWIFETQKLILKTAKWVFAALVLNFLVLANIGAALVILNALRELLP